MTEQQCGDTHSLSSGMSPTPIRVEACVLPAGHEEARDYRTLPPGDIGLLDVTNLSAVEPSSRDALISIAYSLAELNKALKMGVIPQRVPDPVPSWGGRRAVATDAPGH